MANALSMGLLESVRVAVPGFVDLTWNITHDSALIGGLHTVFEAAAVSAAFTNLCNSQREQVNIDKAVFMHGRDTRVQSTEEREAEWPDHEKYVWLPEWGYLDGSCTRVVVRINANDTTQQAQEWAWDRLYKVNTYINLTLAKFKPELTAIEERKKTHTPLKENTPRSFWRRVFGL